MHKGLAGHWKGEGKTREDLPVHVALDLEPIGDGRGLSLALRAKGAEGAEACSFRGILAGRRLAFVDEAVGELKILDRLDVPDRLAFGTAEQAGEESYRLEVSFEPVASREMELVVALALPGEPFAPRLHARLHREP